MFICTSLPKAYEPVQGRKGVCHIPQKQTLHYRPPKYPVLDRTVNKMSGLFSIIVLSAPQWLLQHIQVVTAGANPVSVKKGIDKTCEHLLGKLKENAVPVKGSQDIKVISAVGTLLVSKWLLLHMP